MATNTQGKLLPIEGEFPVDPEIRIQPTVQRAAPTANVGWRYRRRYDITNNADEPLANFPHAIDLGRTDGWVAAGMALSSGNDLRLWHQGREIARTLVDWNSGSQTTLCWLVIPYLGVGETMTVDVVYGNSAAGPPPTLVAGDTLPAFDIQTAGANRSTNAKWVYQVNRIAANAGKGGWYLTSGTAQPDVRHGVPGAWLPVNTLQSDDDRKQESASTYVDSGTKYQGRFEARRAAPGALLVGQDNGMDGVAIRLPLGITAVRSDIRWQNLAIGDTDVTPIGQVVIVTRNAPSETWKTLYSNTALQATEATIATATYTPAGSVKEVAYAVWPQEGNNVDLAARPDRFINAAWYTTLEVHPTSGNVVTTPAASNWTPDDRFSASELPLWLKADAITGLTDGAAVTSWPDSSGNGHDATQGVGAQQPTYQTNEQNGLPIVRFDGIDDILTSGNGAPGIQPVSVAMVAKDVGTSGRFFQSSSGPIQANISTNDATMNAGVTLTYSTGGLTGTAFHIHVLTFNGASSSGSLDGTLVSGNAGTNAGSDGFRLASQGIGAYAQIDFGEVLTFTGGLTDIERVRIEGYLAHKWGLTANLPANHPYKVLAPEDDIYELATELRVDGGGDAVGIPPYRSILLGNAKSASGIGTPRLACKINEQIRIFGAERRIEIWNSALTAKIEDAPIPGYQVIEGVLDENGNTVEQSSLDWLSLMPVVNPLANSTFDSGVNGWSRVFVHALATSDDPPTWEGGTQSLRARIFTSTVPADTIVAQYLADDYLPVGNRSSVVVGLDLRTSDFDVTWLPTIWFYDAAQVLIGVASMAAEWNPALINVFYRRLYAALVPRDAIYFRVGASLFDTTGAQTPNNMLLDTVAVNDTEIALLDVASGTLVMTVKWTPRYAYA